MKKWIIGLLLLMGHVIPLKATHASGGIITYEYTGSSHYRFHLFFIRSCSGVTMGNTVGISTTVPGIASISLIRNDTLSVRDACGTAFGSTSTLDCALGQGFEIYRYSSSPIDFSNVAAPPVDGYHFGFTMCCRDYSANLMTGTPNFYIQTTMHRVLEQGVPLTPAQMQDNSPIPFGWSELVKYVSNDTLLRQMAALDLDGDALRYELVAPLTAFQTNAQFKLPNYSLTGMPFTGAIRHNGVFLDSMSATFLTTNTSTTNDFITVLVKSYRCGQLISSAYYEINSVVQALPPSVAGDNPPQLSGFGVAANGEMYLYPKDTLRAGITVVDTQSGYPNAVRAYFPAAISLSGLQPTLNCSSPPCLQLTATTAANPLPQLPQLILNDGDTLGYGFIAENGLNASLMAYVGCNQFVTTDCGDTVRHFNLPLVVTDSRCAVNNRIELPLRLVQMPLPHLNTPQLQLLGDNTGQLIWESPLDSSLNLPGLTTVSASLRVQAAAFSKYNIYRSSLSNPGNFSLVASITDINQRSWLDPMGNATYYIRVVSGCDEFESPPSNVVASFASAVSDQKLSEIKVFPNPTSALIQVSNGSANVALRLLDIQGREIQKLGEIGENENRSIDLSSYSGVVLMELKTAASISYRRLVILR